MSLPPKSKVVGRVTVKRLCGCEGEFEQLEGDRFGRQRLEKFRQSRCPACAAKRAEEQRKLSLPKGEAYAALPVGAHVVLAFASEGNWVARLTAGGRSVEGSGPGPEAALLAVARLWAAG
jgi:hypothetical protein